MYRFASSVLLAVLAVTPLATKVDNAIALERRQSVNLSTGGISGITTTGVTLIPPTTTTSQGTTSGRVSETTPSATTTPTSSVIVSVTDVTTTLTPTNSQGSVTGSPTVVTSASSASYSVSISSFVTSVSQEYTTTYLTTSNGQTIMATRTSNTLVPVTTSARVTGSLIPANSGGSSGLSESSKKIIGGVVGGVGGALLLGALAFTAWRIWGKKKNLHDDDLYDPNSQQEKLSSSTDNANNTPFQSTLDQYHRPGPVNTASNF